MKKGGSISGLVLLFFIVLCLSISTGHAGVKEDDGKTDARYRIYETKQVVILLDTETGKMWQVSSDMGNKLKAEGVTVEGLAFASSENDTLNARIKELNLSDLPEKDRNKCREELLSKFSYRLDQDKINAITNSYKK